VKGLCLQVVLFEILSLAQLALSSTLVTRMGGKSQRDGRPLDSSKFWSYFLP